jgi:hypothetical protein
MRATRGSGAVKGRARSVTWNAVKEARPIPFTKIQQVIPGLRQPGAEISDVGSGICRIASVPSTQSRACPTSAKACS